MTARINLQTDFQRTSRHEHWPHECSQCDNDLIIKPFVWILMHSYAHVGSASSICHHHQHIAFPAGFVLCRRRRFTLLEQLHSLIDIIFLKFTCFTQLFQCCCCCWSCVWRWVFILSIGNQLRRLLIYFIHPTLSKWDAHFYGHLRTCRPTTTAAANKWIACDVSSERWIRTYSPITVDTSPQRSINGTTRQHNFIILLDTKETRQTAAYLLRYSHIWNEENAKNSNSLCLFTCVNETWNERGRNTHKYSRRSFDGKSNTWNK